MTGSAPLHGVRILDFTQTWAGPLATRILGDLGAEILKIEAPWARGSASDAPTGAIVSNAGLGGKPWNIQGLFNELMRNKMSISIDMSTPDGLALVRELVKVSDAVIDNFSSRVMGNFGLGFDALSELNNRIIALSMPSYGTTGPYKDSVGYGPTMEAASGLPLLCTYEGNDEPFRCGPAYPDPLAGLNAANAVLLALLTRDFVDCAQFIDLSHMEAAICAIGELVVEHQMPGDWVTSLGDRHSLYFPWTSFRCSDSRWIFIGIETEDAWQQLCSVIGMPAAYRSMDRLAREASRQEICARIDRWASAKTADSAENELRSSQVAAAKVLTSADLLTDLQLAAKGAFVSVSHQEAGEFLQPAFPLIWDDSEAWQAYEAAPCFAEHAGHILTDILGLTPSIIERLIEENIVPIEPP